MNHNALENKHIRETCCLELLQYLVREDSLLSLRAYYIFLTSGENSCASDKPIVKYCPFCGEKVEIVKDTRGETK